MATQKRNSRAVCAVDDCEKLSWCRGWCQNHYNSWHRYGDPLQVDRNKAGWHQKCAVEGCEVRAHTKGHCGRHAYKLKRYGDPLAGRESKLGTEAHGFIRAAAEFPVDSDECLLWPYSVNPAGYGVVTPRNGGTTLAHRAVLILSAGEPEDPSLHAAHGCGNPRCVAPGHLRWATAAENNSDKVAHGTWGKRLSEQQARAILTDTGLLREVAERHGVAVSVVGMIRNGDSWGWLQES